MIRFAPSAVLSLALALLVASQAAALSCLRPNVASLFNLHQEREERFGLGVGALRITGQVPPLVEGQPREVEGVFSGRFLGRGGLGERVEIPISVRASCIASWCGGFPEKPTGQVFVYLEKTEAGHRLDIGPCPGALERVTEERLRLLTRCLRRGRCTDVEVARAERL